MAKTAYFTLLIAAALAVGWVANAGREDYEDALAQGIQAGTISQFPYRSCNTSNGAYRLAPVWVPTGSSKYCFKIEVRQDAQSCSGACCTSGLHKIEFNVSSSCLVAGSSVTATLNGVPTRVGPSYDQPPLGPVGSTVLKITQLGLDPVTAQGAELCITLKPNRARQGCTTLEQLCSSPGFPAGTCTAATFDAACDCCPVSQVIQARPPPPPPPPPPPTPPPSAPGYRTCEVCVAAKLVPPPNDIRPYRFSAATCAAIQRNISDAMNAALNASNISPIAAPFAPNSTTCFDDTVLTCGNFNGEDLGKLESLFNEVSGLLPYFIDVASSGNICNPRLQGYTVLITTDGNICLDVSQSASCFLPNQTFPNCTCNTTQGVLPFIVLPSYYSRASPFFGSLVTEYCFTVNTLPAAAIVPSKCYKANDPLAKIEWYADEALRSVVKGYTITPFGGPSKKVFPSWGAPGTSTLKVNLNWNDTMANGGLVCVAVQKPYTMQNLCKGAPGQCYARVFNRDNSDYCCPIFRAGP